MIVNVTPHYSLKNFETPKHKDVNYISKLQVQNKYSIFHAPKLSTHCTVIGKEFTNEDLTIKYSRLICQNKI